MGVHVEGSSGRDSSLDEGIEAEGDGVVVREGERETVPQGDGEAVCEGERETVPKGDDVDPQGGEGGPAAPPGRHVGKIERSVIVEPVAAQLEGHVEKDEGSEAVGLVAQSGGHVGHIESSVVDHVEGSGGMDSYLGEGVQSSNCKYVNCKSKRRIGKLVTRDPGEETDN